MKGSYGKLWSWGLVLAIALAPLAAAGEKRGGKTDKRGQATPALEVEPGPPLSLDVRLVNLQKNANGGVIPTGDWYIKTNSGMGAALTIASQKQAYVLSDDSTFLYRGPSSLAILYRYKAADAGALNNPYSVMEVKNALHPAGAAAFSSYIRSTAGQRVIGRWGVSRFGFSLFTPTAGRY